MSEAIGAVSLVTGGSSGIGAEIVRRLLDRGDSVAVVDLTLPSIDEEGSTGGALAIAADVSQRSQVEDAVAETIGRFGRLDNLYNNAGVMDDFSPAGEVTDEMWDKNFAVNVNGPMFLTRAVLPHMVERGSGVIVNTASAGGLRGGRAGVAYTASKHALIGLTRSVAFQYGPKGIRCNAICPGHTQPTGLMHGTDFNQFGLDAARPVLDTVPPATTPARQAGVAAFLSTDDAAYINGVALLSDGGWLVA